MHAAGGRERHPDGQARRPVALGPGKGGRGAAVRREPTTSTSGAATPTPTATRTSSSSPPSAIPTPSIPAKGLAKVADATAVARPALPGRPEAASTRCPRMRTAAMWGAFFASVGTGLTVGLLNRNRRQGVDLATSLFGQLAPALGDIKIKVQGREHLWSHRPAVFLINHQSSVMDMVVASRLLEREFTFVAKKEISSMPRVRASSSAWPT